MQEYAYSFICILLTIVLLYSIGNYFIEKFDKNGLMLGHELSVGFSITTLILSLYFILPINFAVIAYAYIGIVLITMKGITSKVVNRTHALKAELFVITIPLFVFLLYAVIYGPNFTTFRGNIWDWFNYNTMAVGYSKYSVKDFGDLIQTGNPIAYIANLNLSQRPFVVAIPSAILSITKVDNFSLMYFYKGLLLTILLRGNIQCLLDIGYSKLLSILISLCIVFSSWVVYVVEIDALSNLAFIAFIPALFSVLSRSDNLSRNTSVIPLAFVFAAYFCIYPEYAIICYGVLLLVLIRNYNHINLEIRMAYTKRILFILLLFFLVISLYWEATVNFLVRQIIGGFTTKVDWWGYYGGYLFGPNSPVINPDTVSQVRSELVKGANLYQSQTLINILMNNAVYILPSIFGLFHILAIEHAVIPAFVVSVFVVSAYVHTLFRGARKYLWLKSLSFTIILLLLALLLKGAVWGAIKGLTYLIVLIPLMLAIALFEIKINIIRFSIAVTFILAPLFLVYKYSEYNGGIGKYDGFPSVLKKESKLNIEWIIDLNTYKNCKLINVSIADPFVRHFVILKLENSELPYQTHYPLMESYGFGRLISEPSGVTSNYDCQIK